MNYQKYLANKLVTNPVNIQPEPRINQTTTYDIYGKNTYDVENYKNIDLALKEDNFIYFYKEGKEVFKKLIPGKALKIKVLNNGYLAVLGYEGQNFKWIVYNQFLNDLVEGVEAIDIFEVNQFNLTSVSSYNFSNFNTKEWPHYNNIQILEENNKIDIIFVFGTKYDYETYSEFERIYISSFDFKLGDFSNKTCKYREEKSNVFNFNHPKNKILCILIKNLSCAKIGGKIRVTYDVAYTPQSKLGFFASIGYSYGLDYPANISNKTGFYSSNGTEKFIDDEGMDHNRISGSIDYPEKTIKKTSQMFTNIKPGDELRIFDLYDLFKLNLSNRNSHWINPLVLKTKYDIDTFYLPGKVPNSDTNYLEGNFPFFIEANNNPFGGNTTFSSNIRNINLTAFDNMWKKSVDGGMYIKIKSAELAGVLFERTKALIEYDFFYKGRGGFRENIASCRSLVKLSGSWFDGLQLQTTAVCNVKKADYDFTDKVPEAIFKHPIKKEIDIESDRYVLRNFVQQDPLTKENPLVSPNVWNIPAHFSQAVLDNFLGKMWFLKGQSSSLWSFKVTPESLLTYGVDDLGAAYVNIQRKNNKGKSVPVKNNFFYSQNGLFDLNAEKYGFAESFDEHDFQLFHIGLFFINNQKYTLFSSGESGVLFAGPGDNRTKSLYLNRVFKYEFGDNHMKIKKVTQEKNTIFFKDFTDLTPPNEPFYYGSHFFLKDEVQKNKIDSTLQESNFLIQKSKIEAEKCYNINDSNLLITNTKNWTLKEFDMLKKVKNNQLFREQKNIITVGRCLLNGEDNENVAKFLEKEIKENFRFEPNIAFFDPKLEIFNGKVYINLFGDNIQVLPAGFELSVIGKETGKTWFTVTSETDFSYLLIDLI